MNQFKLIEWFLSDNVGASSEAIVGHMLGIPVRKSWPSDAGDRGRCVALLKAVPEFTQRLHEMNQYEGWDDQIPLILEELKK